MHRIANRPVRRRDYSYFLVASLASSNLSRKTRADNHPHGSYSLRRQFFASSPGRKAALSFCERWFP
jgi:hypothetical protein